MSSTIFAIKQPDWERERDRGDFNGKFMESKHATHAYLMEPTSIAYPYPTLNISGGGLIYGPRKF